MLHPQIAADPGQAWQLVEAAATGDLGAQAAFSRQFEPLVHRWLWFRWRHTPFKSLIEDAAQDVFVECFRPGGALQHVDRTRCSHGVEAYLRGLVQNVALRVERIEARHFHHRRRAVVQAGTLPRLGSAEQLDRDLMQQRVDAALALLDSEDVRTKSGHSLRELLRLHFEGGQPVRAIAQLWDEKVEHVHELRRRACSRFRACLLRVWSGSSAGRSEGGAKEVELGREALALLA